MTGSIVRSLLLGTVAFSKHCLDVLIDSGHAPSAVACMGSDISQFQTDYFDLLPDAVAAGIAGYRLEKGGHDLGALIDELKPDVVLVFGWPRLIGASHLNKPRLGFIGTHPALLPRNRGRHPIVWSLVDGENDGGLTFFRLDVGVDSGPILWQERFAIDIVDHAGDVYEKMEQAASKALPKLMHQLASGTAVATAQDESMANYRRKRGVKDGEVQWTGSAESAYNVIRALARPYAGAHTFFRGASLKLWRAEPPVSGPKGMNLVFGQVLEMDNGALLVAAKDGVLKVTEYQAPGGVTIKKGDVFG